jgi:TonB family protein
MKTVTIAALVCAVGVTQACRDVPAPSSAAPDVASVEPSVAAGILPGALVSLGEAGLRTFLIGGEPPVYPLSALQSGIEGVAVVRVVISPAGQVAGLEVLEAPSGEVGEAVASAVRRWQFRPVRITGSETDSPAEGKLTHYFAIEAGEGLVLSPDEMTRRRLRARRE